MGSKPTERIDLHIRSRVIRFSECGSPKDELIRLLTITQLRINRMRDNPQVGHRVTLGRWGFKAKEIQQLGINN